MTMTSVSSPIRAGARSPLAKAKELGWTVVSMKDDWKNIYQ